MLPGAQLLTAPTSLANYKPEDISSTAKSLIASSFLFLQVGPEQEQEEERMAHSRPHTPSRQRSRTNDDTELWFSMPSSVRHVHPESDRLEQSAYQATSNRHSATRSASPNGFPSIPLISTSAAVNKPLPPSPETDKKKRKPASLRNLIRRRPSGGLDPNHLQPDARQLHQRTSSADGKLSPEPYQVSYQSSRSMPSSPLQYTNTSSNSLSLQRAHSAAANYADSVQYQAYNLQPQPQYPQRSSSMETYFEPQAPRARRTFPETNSPSTSVRPATAVPRDSSDRPRPHSHNWLSPTEPFEDTNEFHLFVEATSGLPDGFDPLSPEGGPQFQGSLFARGRQNDRIPLPFQDSSATQPSQPRSTESWQSMGYDYVPRQSTSEVRGLSSSALPRRDSYDPSRGPNLNTINLELERLGLADEEHRDDELPNYAQSQAEMSAKKRQEATARARELEARWNNSRGWRSR